jgi:hypothetical protein
LRSGGILSGWRSGSILLRYSLTLWVPIIHPCWLGSMPVLAEGAAESFPSADIEVRDLLRIGNRFG